MNKVWAVEGYTPYEGHGLLGLFSTQEKAEVYAKECYANRNTGRDEWYESYDVEEYTLDEK